MNIMNSVYKKWDNLIYYKYKINFPKKIERIDLLNKYDYI